MLAISFITPLLHHTCLSIDGAGWSYGAQFNFALINFIELDIPNSVLKKCNICNVSV